MSEISQAVNANRQKVNAAEVGMLVLKALAALAPATSLSHLAAHLGMPASKVHRYLQALIASGFAEQNASTSHYRLGREALGVGLAALNSLDVIKIAALPLSELRDDLNESCFIAVWGNQGPTVVSIEPAVRAVTLVTQIGSVLPLLGSSTGRVFAAYLPGRETAAFDPPASLEDPGAVARRVALLEGIREQGVHGVQGLLMPGVDAVSAPIFNALGQIVAVMTVVGPASAFPPERQAIMTQRLLQATQQVSWQLGHGL